MSSASNGFLSRWSKRKLEEKESVTDEQALVSDHQAESKPIAETEVSQDTNESMEKEVPQFDQQQSVEEPNQTEGEQSIASLLTSDAEKSIKKAALRKLFLSEEFNQVDRLNDYDHDYSSVKPLATEVAETLRGWVKEQIEESEEEDAVEESRDELTTEQADELQQGSSEQPSEAQAENNLDEELTANVKHSKENKA